MNKFTKLLAITLPLVFSLSSGVAKADVVNDIGSVSGSYANTFSVNGSFFDTLNFHIDNLSNVLIAANPLDLSLGAPPVDIFKILGLTVEFWDNHHPFGLDNHGGPFAGDNTTHSFFSLPAGDYHLDITGNGNGSNGGLYAVALNVNAVPEPETYAMMLAGLGLVGFMARRRKISA